MSSSASSAPTMYLTKSLFQRSLECSRKLIYNMLLHKQQQQRRPQQQQQQQHPTSLSPLQPAARRLLEGAQEPSSFLRHLAADGYRMNRYVQAMYDRDGGILIDSKDTDAAIQQTERIVLGSQPTTTTSTTTLYEAAIRWKHCLVRTDILQVIQDFSTAEQQQPPPPMLKLVEVKAKSWDSSTHPTTTMQYDEIVNHPMMTKDGTVIRSDYVTILYDIAYQYYILSQAYPQLTISSCSFVFPDKSKINTTTPGLYNLFDPQDDYHANEMQALDRHMLLDSSKEVLFTEVDVTSIIPYILHQPLIYPGCDIDFQGQHQQQQPPTFVEVIHNWNDVIECYNKYSYSNHEVEEEETSFHDPNDLLMNQFISQVFNGNNNDNSNLSKKCIAAPIGGHCKGCEFRNKNTATSTKLDCNSGFEYCWRPVLTADSVVRNSTTNDTIEKDSDIEMIVPSPPPQLVIDLYFGGKTVTDALKQGKYLLCDISKKDLKLETTTTAKADDSKKKTKKKANAVGMSRKERQWYHVQSFKNNNIDNNVILDRVYLQKVLEECDYPYHFIDFETIAPILPFTLHKHPYEPIAFQFSHHTLQEDGTTTQHATEFIHTTPGICPNIHFLNTLCDTFETCHTNGTIFRWGSHENTILRSIYASCAVEHGTEIPSIKTMERFFGVGFSDDDDSTTTVSISDVGIVQDGMIDLMSIILKGYYVHGSNGSASIKSLLLPTLQYSAHLRELYEAPIYTSTNFTNMQWWMEDEPGSGIPIDPYKLLQTADGNDLGSSTSSVVKHGGDAIAAYSMLQGRDVDVKTRIDVEKSLLRYCELDTLAMVMVMQSLIGYLK